MAVTDKTTTGSAMAGTVPGGLRRGFGQRVSAVADMTDKVIFVFGDPNDVVTVSVGSQLAYDVENQDIYVGLGQNGSEWNRLGSLT